MPDLVDAVERVMAQGVAVDLEIDEKKPIERAFRVKMLPLPTGYSAPERDQPALMLMLHDLTSERRLEHMRVDFVANASHELRTPLASLLGFIETLQGPAKNDTTARERFLEIMRSQARRMTRLIDDLLSLSRVELNAHRQPVDPVDLAPLVEHMAESLMTLAKERGVVRQEIERLVLFLGPGSGVTATPADLAGFVGVEPDARGSGTRLAFAEGAGLPSLLLAREGVSACCALRDGFGEPHAPLLS
jgi:signal transduction histidine kinase